MLNTSDIDANLAAKNISDMLINAVNNHNDAGIKTNGYTHMHAMFSILSHFGPALITSLEQYFLQSIHE